MDRPVLEGKTALVTGPSQGIGLASARALARDDATAVITGRREEALASARESLSTELPAARFEMFAGDASDEDGVKAALSFAHGLNGRLDIVASIVGEPAFKPLLMRELDDVKQEFAANFNSAFLAVRHSVPLMQPGLLMLGPGR